MSELLSTSRIYYLVPVVKREAGNPEKSAPVYSLYLDALFGYNTKSIHLNVHSSRLSMWKSFSAVRLPLWKVATGWDLPFSSCSSIQSPNPSWSGGVFKYFLPFIWYFFCTHLIRWPETWGSPWVWRCCPLPRCGWPGGRWCRWTARTPPSPWSGHSGAGSRSGTRRMFPEHNHKVRCPLVIMWG